MIEHLSASSVKSFSECEKRFFLRYVHPREPLEEEDNKYIQVGNAVHESIEDTLKETDSRNADNLLDKFWQNDPEYYEESERDKVQSCFETASKYVEKHVGDDIRAIEDRWTMDYDGIELVGYCDVVENGHIIDWKTGKSEGKELKEKIQASFYIKLFENEYGEYPEHVDFAYLDDGTRSTHERFTDGGEVLWNSHQNKYWEDTESIINKILLADNTDEWTPDPERDKCHWCSEKFFCEDGGVGAENVEKRHIAL